MKFLTVRSVASIGGNVLAGAGGNGCLRIDGARVETMAHLLHAHLGNDPRGVDHLAIS